jgi:hypothetical protein
VKRRVGCAVFLLLGFFWLGFVAFDLFVSVYGDCFDDEMCAVLKNVSGSRALWRGFAVGLLLCIAYAVYRRFFEDEDVQ